MTNRKIRNKYRSGLLFIVVFLMMVSLKTLAKDLRPKHPRPDLIS